MHPKVLAGILLGVAVSATAQPASPQQRVTPPNRPPQTGKSAARPAESVLPNDVILMKAGKDYRYHGQFGPAFELYERVVRQYPQSPYMLDALFYRAHCKHRLGLKTEALQLYAEYLAAAPAGHELVPSAHQARAGLCQELRDKECLRALLKDQDGATRFRAAWSLARLGDNAGVPILIEALQSRDTALADRARVALFILHDPRGMEALKKSPPETARGPVVRMTINGNSVWVNSGMGDLLIDAMTPAQRESLERAGVTAKQLSDLNERSGTLMTQVPATGEEIRIQVVVPAPR